MCVCKRSHDDSNNSLVALFFHYIANVKFIRGINSAEHNAKLQIDRKHFILCKKFLVSSSVRLTAYKFNCNEKNTTEVEKKEGKLNLYIITNELSNIPH